MAQGELIRAEIEKQKDYYDKKEMEAWNDAEYGDEDALFYQGKRKMCATLLAFIDSLPEEKPSEDLEKEVFDWAGKFNPNIREYIESTAFHFAEWQKEQMKPIRVVPMNAWMCSDGRVFAPELRIVDDGCNDAILVPGFNEEFTIYKEAEK